MGQIHSILESLDRVLKEPGENRRGAPRIPVRMGLAATVLGGPALAPMRIYTRNVSRSGIAFLSRRLFAPGERLAIAFHLPNQPAKLVLAQVTFGRYVRQALYESGARFVESIPDVGGPDRFPAHWNPISMPA
jgi:hypothetical protein